ncbi:MAG: hypothetical protein M4579_004267 [Chaenotheca gracillima]|nr:MAG: hypothetical protein M4579_004267 [Chaenotheca gracillima]
MVFSSMKLALAICAAGGLVGASPSNKPAPKDTFSPSHWPLPHNVTGDTNGWGGVHLHDPAIVKGPNGYYYSFSTHDLVTIGRSRSLDGYWKHLGSVLHGESTIDLPGRNDTWAPDVHKVGDTYYLYYSVSTFGSQNSGIGLATSKTLEPGTWTDHGLVLESSNSTAGPIPNNVTNAIDPNLFIDPKTSKAWMTYGSFFGDLWQFALSKDLKKVEYDPTPLQLSYDPVAPNPEEGSYISHHDDWYYLWFSHGTCCGFNTTLPAPGDEYSIRLGRSKSPQGPFVDMNGTDLVNGGGYIVYGSHGLVYGPGGQGVLTDVHGRDVLYYHYFNKYISLVDEDCLLGWDYIEYVNGWPVLVY